MAAPLNYEQFIAEREADTLIPFEAFGRTFHIRTIEALGDDEAAELLDLLSSDDLPATAIVRMAELCIDDWPAFSAAGGTAMGLTSFMKHLLSQKEADAQATQGAGVGESEAS